MIRYLTKRLIVRINKATVQEHGGNFMPPHNFLHEENLDYLLEAVQAEMFGEPLYSAISNKAALYCFNIIGNHIFTDGNKRTGLGAALLFLNLNRYDLRLDVSNPMLTDFILQVASGKSSLDGCWAWFATHTVQIS